MTTTVPGMDDKLLQKFTCGVCSRTDTDEIERSTVKLLGKKFQLKLNDESQWRERIVLKVGVLLVGIVTCPWALFPADLSAPASIACRPSHRLCARNPAA